MRGFVVSRLALPSVLALVLGMVGTGDASAATMLASPADFSGTETVVTFEGLPQASGAAVTSAGGVGFMLASGNGPKFRVDMSTREFGPAGAGSVDNVVGESFPFPGLTMTLPQVVHRMSFEIRTEFADGINVTLRNGGAVVDSFALSSKGPFMLGFQGFELPGGFDEVVLDVAANVAGAFVLDNVRFESLAPPAPPDPGVVPGGGGDDDDDCSPTKAKHKKHKKAKKGKDHKKHKSHKKARKHCR